MYTGAVNTSFRQSPLNNRLVQLFRSSQLPQNHRQNKLLNMIVQNGLINPPPNVIDLLSDHVDLLSCLTEVMERMRRYPSLSVLSMVNKKFNASIQPYLSEDQDEDRYRIVGHQETSEEPREGH